MRPRGVRVRMQSAGRPVTFDVAVANLSTWVSQLTHGPTGRERCSRMEIPVDPGLSTPLDWLRVQQSSEIVSLGLSASAAPPSYAYRWARAPRREQIVMDD